MTKGLSNICYNIYFGDILIAESAEGSDTTSTQECLLSYSCQPKHVPHRSMQNGVSSVPVSDAAASVSSCSLNCRSCADCVLI